MKKFIMTLCALFISFASGAQTITVNWLNEDKTNYSTTVCESGGDLNIPATPIKRGYTFMGWMPANVTRVEYISAAGGQYIDTGIMFDSDEIEYITKIRFSKNYTGAFGALTKCVYPTDARGSSSAGALLQSINNRPEFWTGETRDFFSVNTGTTNVYDIYMKKSTRAYSASVNDVVQRGTYSGTPVSDKTVWLGSVNANATDSSCFFNGLIYWFQIKKDGVLVRDMVPVIDLYGTACMYDRVSKQILYNNGTGNFVAGPVITEEN